MTPIIQIYSVFKKDLLLENQFRLAVLNKMFLGPILNALPAAILYVNFFNAAQGLSLGGFTHANLSSHLFFAIAFHMLINSGYYCCSQKLLSDWKEGVLVTLRMAPCSIFVLMVGLCATDILKNFVLLSMGYFIATHFKLIHIVLTPTFLLLFLNAFLIGVLLGIIRVSLYLSKELNLEIMDHLYRVMIFFSCFYIPIDLLPRAIRPLCKFIPTFHLNQIANHLNSGDGIAPHSYEFMSLGLLVILLGALTVWYMTKDEILESTI